MVKPKHVVRFELLSIIKAPEGKNYRLAIRNGIKGNWGKRTREINSAAQPKLHQSETCWEHENETA